MNTYIADTNFYLRFILQDIKDQANITEKYLELAKSGEINIIFLDEVILEMEFVLRSFYSIKRADIVQSLNALIKLNYVDIENRTLWAETLETYRKKKLSLLDIVLFYKAKEINSDVLSFDEDFKRLKRYERQNIRTN